MANRRKKSGEPFIGHIRSVGEPAGTESKSARAAPNAVHFADGALAYLKPSDPRTPTWANVLRSLQERNWPAYIEHDADSGVITNLLMPTLNAVREIRDDGTKGDYIIDLHMSHAVHHLRRSNRDFKSLLAAFQRAQKSGEELWVIETPDTHEIIDVRKKSEVAR